MRGISDCEWLPWSYEEIEQRILNEIKEVDIAAIINGTEYDAAQHALRVHVNTLTIKLEDIENRIQGITTAIELGNDIPVLVSRLQDLILEQQLLTTDLDNANVQLMNTKSHTTKLLSAQHDIANVGNVTPAMRMKLRSRLRDLIDTIDVWLHIHKIIIRYKAWPDDEQQTKYVFKSGSSIMLYGDSHEIES